LANHLDTAFPILDQPINLHVTGCHHSCAQHYIGDIGLMGVKVGGEEGYQVLIGGGADSDQQLARELIPAIRFVELAPKLERLFASYVAKRETDETFLHFAHRHDITVLRSFCDQENA
jgi:ferredoxin-nitrite reductase